MIRKMYLTITKEELSAMLHLSVRQTERWIEEGKLPKPAYYAGKERTPIFFMSSIEKAMQALATASERNLGVKIIKRKKVKSNGISK